MHQFLVAILHFFNALLNELYAASMRKNSTILNCLLKAKKMVQLLSTSLPLTFLEILKKIFKNLSPDES
jgi:hypothetical protein